ncbi:MULTISPECIES: DUF167 domain-containing protein [unclassified Paludibacterium]|uniref:DUF167 domain-containing protein n=1 Tax=unclassified Paludibacterium TaxID=2618429 RepID=UPI001C050F1D|nr:DUF167 domain-containing protein [Paludibacterium sp. B53371]BEV72419.1 hypothetical protein THUN1379_19010 [Paludibacterium sp. THUN1379]
MKSWLKPTENGFNLTLHVQPGAKKTEVSGEHGEALKIRLAAPPVDGKANAALLRWLSDRFDLPQRAVELLSGDKSRHKIVAIRTDCSETELMDRLGVPQD